MTTVEEVNAAILGFSNEQINEVISAINFRRRALRSSQMARFNTGDRVTFKHRHRKCIGTVTKTNQKTVTVREDTGMLWRISPQLLTKVSA